MKTLCPSPQKCSSPSLHNLPSHCGLSNPHPICIWWVLFFPWASIVNENSQNSVLTTFLPNLSELLLSLCVVHICFSCRWCPVPPGGDLSLRSTVCSSGQLHLPPLPGITPQHSALLSSCCTESQVDCGVWWSGDADLSGSGWKGKGQRCVPRPCRDAQLHVFAWRPVSVAGRFALQWLGLLSLWDAARSGGRQWYCATKGQRWDSAFSHKWSRVKGQWGRVRNGSNYLEM